MACTNCSSGCTSCLPCDCNPCTSTGCPIQLDFSCVLYHKDNNEATELDGFAATNGVTLEAIIEDLDERIKQLKFGLTDVTLPYLRADYTVNTLQQFAVAVDSALSALETAIGTPQAASQVNGYLGAVPADPSAIDGQYWYNTTSSTLKIKLNGTVKTITTA